MTTKTQTKTKTQTQATAATPLEVVGAAMTDAVAEGAGLYVGRVREAAPGEPAAREVSYLVSARSGDQALDAIRRAVRDPAGARIRLGDFDDDEGPEGLLHGALRRDDTEAVLVTTSYG